MTKLKKVCFVLILLSVCVNISGSSIFAELNGVYKTIYVCTNGNDNTEGSKEKPFKTIQRAKDEVRKISKNMTGDIVVEINDGEYYIENTINFEEKDSGYNGFKVIYKSTNNKTNIYNGRKISNWEQHTKDIYKAYVGKDFNSLYENEEISTKARYPDNEYLKVNSVQSGKEKIEFNYKEGDIPENYDYKNSQLYIWSGEANWNWYVDVVNIKSIDTVLNKVVLENEVLHNINPGCRYYIKNVKEFINTPGEFYYEKNSGYVYYYPINLNIGSQNIVAPNSTRAFAFIGDLSNKVSNIVLEKLKISDSDFTEYHSGIVNAKTEGMIYLENTSNIEISNCKLLNAGCNAILLRYANNNNIIQGNLIENVGASAIILHGYNLGEGVFNNPKDAYVNKNNKIFNNKINKCGMIIGDGCGIEVKQSGGNIISNNNISKINRAGISIGGGENFHQIIGKTIYGMKIDYENHWNVLLSRENIVQYNNISSCLLDSSDAGGIECGNTGKNNVLQHNVISNIGEFKDPKINLFIGIYLDDCSDYITVKNNYIKKINGVPIFVKGVYNNISGNIIMDSTSNEASMVFWAYKNERNDHLTVESNVIYKNEGRYVYSFGDWSEDKFLRFEKNIVFHPGGTYFIQYIENEIEFGEWSEHYWKNNSKIDDPMIIRNSDLISFDEKSNSISNGFFGIDLKYIGIRSNFIY